MFGHRGWHQWASKNCLSERIFRMIPSGLWAPQTDPTGQEKLSPHTLTPPQCPKLNFWAFSDLNFYVLVFSPQYPLKWHTFCSDERQKQQNEIGMSIFCKLMNLFYFPHKRMHILPSNHHSICADMVREKWVGFSRKIYGNVLNYFSIEPTVFSLPRWTSHVQNKICDKQRTTQNSTGQTLFKTFYQTINL